MKTCTRSAIAWRMVCAGLLAAMMLPSCAAPGPAGRAADDVRARRDEPVSMVKVGEFFAASTVGQLPQTVTKVEPKKGEAPLNKYCVVYANNLNSPRGGPWHAVSAQRRFTANGGTVPPVNEPALELGDQASNSGEGTIVVSGTAPIVVVKKATVSSEGTQFAIEATLRGGWTLAVISASSPVLVHLPSSPVPIRVLNGECVHFEEGWDGIQQPTPTPAQYDALVKYACWLWRSTGESFP